MDIGTVTNIHEIVVPAHLGGEQHAEPEPDTNPDPEPETVEPAPDDERELVDA